jgi:hypothetical protein
MEHLKGTTALTENIGLGWKGLPAANTSVERKSLNYGSKKFYSTGSSLQRQEPTF